MNKEQQELLNEAYDNYYNHFVGYDDIPIKEVFIFECKTNHEFSKKWGLKIEEQELSWIERRKLLTKEQSYDFGFLSPFTEVMINYYLNQKNIPTKLITITYNDKTIESYE